MNRSKVCGLFGMKNVWRCLSFSDSRNSNCHSLISLNSWVSLSSFPVCLEVLACRGGRYSLGLDQCSSVKSDYVLDTSSSEHSARLSIPTMAKQSDPSNVVCVAIPALKTLSSGKLLGSAASADCMNQRQPSALTIAIHQPRWFGS